MKYQSIQVIFPFCLLLFAVSCKDNNSQNNTTLDTGSSQSLTDDQKIQRDYSSCDGVACWDPPPQECSESNGLTLYSTKGVCSLGECIYAEKDEICLSGTCEEGKCSLSPCQGLVCNTPPVAKCAEENATTLFAGTGYCNEGNCYYASKEEQCGGATTCNKGVCGQYSCKGVYCDKPPASHCVDESTLKVYAPRGACTSSDLEFTCRHSTREIACTEGCLDGHCTEDICKGVTCNLPPARFCDGSNLIVYDVRGRCSKGICKYTPQKVACTLGCENAACIGESPCKDVSCGNPPANYCLDESNLRKHVLPGLCTQGYCEYYHEDVPCTGGCHNGHCNNDPCIGVICNAPPANACSKGTLSVWNGLPGVCENGNCIYGTESIQCDEGCSNGSCTGDPCQGITCKALPSNYCEDEKTAISFEKAVGECIGEGACAFQGVSIVCEDKCENGECIPKGCSGTIQIPDENLESAIQKALNIDTSEFTYETVSRLSYMDGEDLEISDLTGINCLSGLKDLDLSGNKIADLSPIGKLHKLTNLNLSSNQITNISPLSELTGLVSLRLNRNSIVDISPISKAKELSSVSLSENPIENIEVLKELPLLKVVSLMGCPVSDITPLSQLPSLKFLELFAVPISDLAALENLVLLEELYLLSMQTNDLSPLSELTALKTLWIVDSYIEDISPLSSLIQLQELSLSDNSITDVSPLSSLTNLNSLDLVNNPIETIESLVANSGLSTNDSIYLDGVMLYCGDTNITELESRGVTIYNNTCWEEDIEYDTGVDSQIDTSTISSSTSSSFTTSTTCTGCSIDDICYSHQQVNPDNVCEICDNSNPTVWTSTIDGTNCDDGLYCNGDEECQAGTCTGVGGPVCPDNGLECDGIEICDDVLDQCTPGTPPCGGDETCIELYPGYFCQAPIT